MHETFQIHNMSLFCLNKAEPYVDCYVVRYGAAGALFLEIHHKDCSSARKNSLNLFLFSLATNQQRYE